MLELVMMVVAHPNNDEYSCKAEANSYAEAENWASIQNGIECQIEIIIPCLTQKTEQTQWTLETYKEGEVKNKELVKAGKNVLLDKWNSSKVAAENSTGRQTYQ